MNTKILKAKIFKIESIINNEPTPIKINIAKKDDYQIITEIFSDNSANEIVVYENEKYQIPNFFNGKIETDNFN